MSLVILKKKLKMLFRVFTIMKVQATIGQNKEIQKRSNSLAKGTTS